jgi:hypothetical protein
MSRRAGLILVAVVLATVFMLGFLAGRWQRTPTVTVVTKDNVKTVYVDRPVIETRDVVKYVQDTAEVAKLLAEQAFLENKVSVLTETLAALKGSGAGTITYVDRPVPGETRTVREAHFADWRLTFDAVDANATYRLSQKFEALTTVGKDRTGQPTAAVRLFEVGPGETRTPLTDAKTTVVAALPDRPRWHTTVALQGGVGLGPAGIVGVRWLQHGTPDKSAEGARWALLSPVVRLDGQTVLGGLAPVSFNLGTLPRVIFRDLWVLPMVYLDGGSFKVGGALAASF